MNNICSHCGTENEEKYQYCKNCGMPLRTESSEKTNKDYQTFENSQKPDSNNMFYNTPKGFTVDNIEGIPQEEMSLFIGKKAYEILPKFFKMEVTQSKVSWCWPAAILGLLFGPMGTAIWFFYRKMYKPAVILSVIGTVLAFVISLLTVGSSEINFEVFLNSFANGDYNAALDSVKNTETLLTMITGAVNDIISLLTFLFSGLYGYHFYKRHCISKIQNFKMYHADQRYYRLGLASIGGVSGGMVAVGILIIVCVTNATTILTTILSSI